MYLYQLGRVFLPTNKSGHQARRKLGGGGHLPSQFLADKLTLYQPGGQIMCPSPQIVRPSDSPGCRINLGIVELQTVDRDIM